MPRLLLTIGVLVAALCWTTLAGAEEEAPVAPVGAAAPATMQGLAETLAAQVSRLIADLPRARMDLAVVIRSELPSPGEGQPQRLPQVLHGLLLGTLSRGDPFRSVRGPQGPGWGERDRARGAAGDQGYELLLWLEVTEEQNHVIIRGTLYDTEHHVWREVVEPEQHVVGEVFARARVNAELRRYLGALPRQPLAMASVALGARLYLSLAVADLDGDDRNELVLLSPRTVEIWRLGAAEATVVTSFRIGLPRATTRTRDPVGTLVVGPRRDDGSRLVALRTSDHGQGMIVRFDGAEFQLEGTIADFPIRWENEPECTTLRPGRNAFETAPAPCNSLGVTTIVTPFTASVAERIYRPQAPVGSLGATVLADGTVALEWNDRQVSVIGPFGTALAVTDVDDDGRPEVLLSSDRDPWTGDELTVVRLDLDGEGATREQIGRVDGSVWVAGAGDIDDDGLRELLAVSQAPAAAQLLVIE